MYYNSSKCASIHSKPHAYSAKCLQRKLHRIRKRRNDAAQGTVHKPNASYPPPVYSGSGRWQALEIQKNTRPKSCHLCPRHCTHTHACGVSRIHHTPPHATCRPTRRASTHTVQPRTRARARMPQTSNIIPNAQKAIPRAHAPPPPPPPPISATQHPPPTPPRPPARTHRHAAQVARRSRLDALRAPAARRRARRAPPRAPPQAAARARHGPALPRGGRRLGGRLCPTARVALPPPPPPPRAARAARARNRQARASATGRPRRALAAPRGRRAFAILIEQTAPLRFRACVRVCVCVCHAFFAARIGFRACVAFARGFEMSFVCAVRVVVFAMRDGGMIDGGGGGGSMFCVCFCGNNKRRDAYFCAPFRRMYHVNILPGFFVFYIYIVISVHNYATCVDTLF